MALGGVELLLDDAGQRLEVGLGPDVVVDEHDGAVEQLATRRDETRRRTWCRRCRSPGRRAAACAAPPSAPSRRRRPRRAGRRVSRQATAIRSCPNDFSGKLGFAHGGNHGARTGAVVVSDARGFMFPRTATGRSSLVPPPPWHYSGSMLTIEFRTSTRRGRRAAARPADPGGRRSGRGRRHLGRLAELQRHVRGAARPGAGAVPGDLRRRALRVRGADVQPVRVHLGRQGLRDGPRVPPGLSEEARRRCTSRDRSPSALPGHASSRADASAPRARRTVGG